MGLGILDDVKAQHEIAQAFYNHALQIQPKSSKALNEHGIFSLYEWKLHRRDPIYLAALEQNRIMRSVKQRHSFI